MISLLRPRTILSKVVSGSGRWGVGYAEYGNPSFCLVLAGSCWLTMDGAAPLRLDQGDFLLMPASPAFTLTSKPGMAPADLTSGARSEGIREVRHGDPSGPADVRLIGGYFGIDPINAALLFDLLPVMIVVPHTDGGADRLRQVVRLIGEEAGEDMPGRDSILERLVEILLIEALRRGPGQEDARPGGLLAGLADPRIATALRRMHGDVAHPWTVAKLARDAGMSRASFADHFARAVGMPPMHYLLRWRMALARELLRDNAGQLEQVATAIGYRSASAFSTAFSRHMGVAPSVFARTFATDHRAAA